MNSGKLEAIRDRFWEKVERLDPAGCWTWIGSVGRKNGCAQMRVAGRIEQAARISYMLAGGEAIEDGVVIDHVCGNRLCVNPAHMQLVGRRAWTDAEDHYLRRMYCFVPVDHIAEELGRTVTAVQVRRKEIGIVALQQRDDVLSPLKFAEAVGVGWGAARRLADMEQYSATMYHGNQATRVVLVDGFKRWLGEPANWQHLDVDKLVRPDFREVVERARRKNSVPWLLLEEAAGYVGYSASRLKTLARRGKVPFERGHVGQRGRARLLFKKADLDQFKQAYGR